MTRTSNVRRVRRLFRSDRGQGLLEAALILPLLLLVSVSVFEFGRAYQTIQVLTNAAREGARLAIMPTSTSADVVTRVRSYMTGGSLPNAATAGVVVNQNATVTIGAGKTASATVVTISYPFSFVVLNPIARLVTPGAKLGAAPITLTASAQMRNEAQ
jgi:Flp pilus assembly protein TadG